MSDLDCGLTGFGLAGMRGLDTLRNRVKLISTFAGLSGLSELRADSDGLTGLAVTDSGSGTFCRNITIATAAAAEIADGIQYLGRCVRLPTVALMRVER